MPKAYRPYRHMHRLLAVYRFIQQYELEHKCAPSYTDIVNAELAPSTSVVKFFFDHMEKLGMISYQPGIARSVRALPLPTDVTPLTQAILQEKGTHHA
jgi:hypothetical protein